MKTINKKLILTVLLIGIFCLTSIITTSTAFAQEKNIFDWSFEKGKMFYSPNEGMISLKSTKIKPEALAKYPSGYKNLSNNFYESGVVQRQIDLTQKKLFQFYIPPSAPSHVYVPGIEAFYMNTLALEIRPKVSEDDFNTREGANFLYIRLGLVSSNSTIPMLYTSISYENAKGQWGLSANLWHNKSVELKTNLNAADYNKLELVQEGGKGNVVSLWLNGIKCEMGPADWILRDMDFSDADISIRTFFMDKDAVVDISSLNPLSIQNNVATTSGEDLTFDVVNAGSTPQLSYNDNVLTTNDYEIKNGKIIIFENFIKTLPLGENKLYITKDNMERCPITIFKNNKLLKSDIIGDWTVEGNGLLQDNKLTNSGKLHFLQKNKLNIIDGVIIPLKVQDTSNGNIVANVILKDSKENKFKIEVDYKYNNCKIYYNNTCVIDTFAGWQLLNNWLRINVYKVGTQHYFAINESIVSVPPNNFGSSDVELSIDFSSPTYFGVEIKPLEIGKTTYNKTLTDNGYVSLAGSSISKEEDGINKFEFVDPRLVNTAFADETSFDRIVTKKQYLTNKPIVFYMHYENVNWIGLKLSSLPYDVTDQRRESEDFSFTFWSNKSHNGIRTFDGNGTNARWFYPSEQSNYKDFSSLDRFELIVGDNDVRITSNESTYTAIDTRYNKKSFPHGIYLQFAANAEQYNKVAPRLYLSDINALGFKDNNIYNHKIGSDEDIIVRMDGLESGCIIRYNDKYLDDSFFYLGDKSEIILNSKKIDELFVSSKKANINLIIENGDGNNVQLKILGNSSDTNINEPFTDEDVVKGCSNISIVNNNNSKNAVICLLALIMIFLLFSRKKEEKFL